MTAFREAPVVVEGLNHHYGKGALRRQILFDVSTTIPAGEIVIERRQRLAFDVSNNDHKIDGLAGNLTIRMGLRIVYLDRLALADLEADDGIFEVGQRLLSTYFQEIIFAFTAGKCFSSD